MNFVLHCIFSSGSSASPFHAGWSCTCTWWRGRTPFMWQQQMFVTARLELGFADPEKEEKKGIKGFLKRAKSLNWRRSLHSTCLRSLQMKVDTIEQSCNLGSLSQNHQAIVFYIYIILVFFFLPSPPFFLIGCHPHGKVILLDKLASDNDRIIIKCQDMQPTKLPSCYYTGWCAKGAHKNAVKNIYRGTCIQLEKKTNCRIIE